MTLLQIARRSGQLATAEILVGRGMSASSGIGTIVRTRAMSASGITGSTGVGQIDLGVALAAMGASASAGVATLTVSAPSVVALTGAGHSAAGAVATLTLPGGSVALVGAGHSAASGVATLTLPGGSVALAGAGHAASAGSADVSFASAGGTYPEPEFVLANGVVQNSSTSNFTGAKWGWDFSTDRAMAVHGFRNNFRDGAASEVLYELWNTDTQALLVSLAGGAFAASAWSGTHSLAEPYDLPAGNYTVTAMPNSSHRFRRIDINPVFAWPEGVTVLAGRYETTGMTAGAFPDQQVDLNSYVYGMVDLFIGGEPIVSLQGQGSSASSGHGTLVVDVGAELEGSGHSASSGVATLSVSTTWSGVGATASRGVGSLGGSFGTHVPALTGHDLSAATDVRGNHYGGDFHFLDRLRVHGIRIGIGSATPDVYATLWDVATQTILAQTQVNAVARDWVEAIFTAPVTVDEGAVVAATVYAPNYERFVAGAGFVEDGRVSVVGYRWGGSTATEWPSTAGAGSTAYGFAVPLIDQAVESIGGSGPYSFTAAGSPDARGNWWGYDFTVAEEIDAVGARCFVGATRPAQVAVWNVDTQTVLASGWLKTKTGEWVSDGFDSPVTLVPGTTYYVGVYNPGSRYLPATGATYDSRVTFVRGRWGGSTVFTEFPTNTLTTHYGYADVLLASQDGEGTPQALGTESL